MTERFLKRRKILKISQLTIQLMNQGCALSGKVSGEGHSTLMTKTVSVAWLLSLYMYMMYRHKTLQTDIMLRRRHD